MRAWSKVVRVISFSRRDSLTNILFNLGLPSFWYSDDKCCCVLCTFMVFLY